MFDESITKLSIWNVDDLESSEPIEAIGYDNFIKNSESSAAVHELTQEPLLELEVTEDKYILLFDQVDTESQGNKIIILYNDYSLEFYNNSADHKRYFEYRLPIAKRISLFYDTKHLSIYEKRNDIYRYIRFSFKSIF